MKIIAVTGINGFVGQNLTTMNPNYSIVGVSRTANPVKNIYTYDDLFEGKIDNLYGIVHCAGIAHDTSNSNFTDDDYEKVNHKLTIRLYEWFAASEAKKFVFLSSSKVYADDVDEVITEDFTCEPATIYGITKLKAEEFIRTYSKVAADQRYYILRPVLIYGAPLKGNLKLLSKMIKVRIPWIFSRFENRRSYLSINNLKFIITSLLEEDIASDTFNVANNTPVSSNELVKMMAKGKFGFVSLPVGKKVVTGLFKFLGAIGAPFNENALKKITSSFVVSNSKVLAALNNDLPEDSDTIKNYS